MEPFPFRYTKKVMNLQLTITCIIIIIFFVCTYMSLENKSWKFVTLIYREKGYSHVGAGPVMWIIKSAVWESATRAVYESHSRGVCIVEYLVTGLHSPTLMLLQLVWRQAFVIAFTIVLPNLCYLPLWSHLPIEVIFKECTCTTGDHIYSCVKTTKTFNKFKWEVLIQFSSYK